MKERVVNMAMCDTDKVKLQKKIVKSWFNDPLVMSATKGDGKFFKKMFYTITGEDYDYGALPSGKKLKKLEIRFRKKLNW